MRFTHRILILPTIAALGFLALATFTWRGNDESRRLSEQIEERFFADLELSLRLQNVVLVTRQAFLTAVNVDEEMGVLEAAEDAATFRVLVEGGLARPQLDPQELRSLLALYEGYSELAVPAVHALATKEMADITEEEFTAIVRMNAHYEDLSRALADRTARSQTEMDEAFRVSRRQQRNRQRGATLAATIGLALLLGVSAAIIVSILRPLHNIMRGTESIAAGDLYQRIDYRSKDMLGRLADSFRKMQRSLIRDVNHRKRAEVALRGSEERLALALDAAGGGLWDVDLVEKEVYLSPGYVSILGYPASEEGRAVPSLVDLCRSAERDRLRRTWRAHVVNGDPFDVEIELERKDGRWRWIRARGKIVEQDTTGKPRRSIGTIADVTGVRGGGTQSSASCASSAAAYDAQAVLEDVGRPVTALLSSLQGYLASPGNGGTDREAGRKRGEILAVARTRASAALDASSRLVEFDRSPESAVTLDEVVQITGALVGRELRTVIGGEEVPRALRFPGELVRSLRNALATVAAGGTDSSILVGYSSGGGRAEPELIIDCEGSVTRVPVPGVCSSGS